MLPSASSAPCSSLLSCLSRAPQGRDGAQERRGAAGRGLVHRGGDRREDDGRQPRGHGGEGGRRRQTLRSPSWFFSSLYLQLCRPPDLTAAGPQNVVNLLALSRSVGPPTSSEHQSSSFSRPQVALYVLSKPSPGAIDPVPESVQSQSILKGSRPKLSNSWCPSWRARRGPRWEAAAWARGEAKRSNISCYHMPSMARQRGGAAR